MRGGGCVEPNPMVGCVIIDARGVVAAIAHHRRYGGPHAEAEAIRIAGPRARGATLYVTLEPCAHLGKTPPCTDAIVAAGVRRVVYCVADPNPIAAGGADRLRAAGVVVDRVADCPLAERTLAPFVHGVTTGRPWVVAKWAQTLDGRSATRTGESQWISSRASRRLVHRLRGRVDAIITGIGTVTADDPLLTARDVPLRRIARRVVIDPGLDVPMSSKLVHTARQTPLLLACLPDAMTARPDRAEALRLAGVELLAAPRFDESWPDVAVVLRHLRNEFGAASALVESGAGLLGHLLHRGLVDQTITFIAPTILGDDQARPAVRGRAAPSLADGVRLDLLRVTRRSDDIIALHAVHRTPEV